MATMLNVCWAKVKYVRWSLTHTSEQDLDWLLADRPDCSSDELIDEEPTSTSSPYPQSDPIDDEPAVKQSSSALEIKVAILTCRAGPVRPVQTQA